jgi:hypothetical protein
MAGRRRNEQVDIETALFTTSGRDQDFLRSMAEAAGASSTDSGRRTGMWPNAVGNYRTRLMDAGLIEPAGYGLVDFAIPGLREYMASHPPRPYEQASTLMDTGIASVSIFRAVVHGPL